MDYPMRLRPETFAASTGHGIEYGVTFCDEETPEGEAGDTYGDLITMVDERADATTERIERALAETMAFAQEVARRWNAHADFLAALEGIAGICCLEHAREEARMAIARARGKERL